LQAHGALKRANALSRRAFMQCLATSTLGGRDDRMINLGKHLSKIFGAVHSEAWDSLSIATPLDRAKCRDEPSLSARSAITRIFVTRAASPLRNGVSPAAACFKTKGA
jgi:hypothetical protein